jgi:hypothetical protein
MVSAGDPNPESLESLCTPGRETLKGDSNRVSQAVIDVSDLRGLELKLPT